MLIRFLRAWYGLRERFGHPRNLSPAEFDRASSTVLLAGSPWVWVSTGSTAASGPSFTLTTNTTWTNGTK